MRETIMVALKSRLTTDFSTVEFSQLIQVLLNPCIYFVCAFETSRLAPCPIESPLFDPGFEACNNHSHHEATAASSGIALAAGNRTLRGQLAGCRCDVVAEGRG